MEIVVFGAYVQFCVVFANNYLNSQKPTLEYF